MSKQLEAFERALDLAGRAERLKTAVRVIGRDVPPGIGNKLFDLAVVAEDKAREAANVVRMGLGGAAVPDPGDPPPVRPDD